MKRLVIDRERCTGCESCVLTCSFVHEDLFALDWSRIQIERDEAEGRFEQKVCVQCKGRFCVSSCPVGALSIDPELGSISLNRTLCTSCRACERACPYSGVHFVDEHPYPLICDLCGGQPACVETCKMPEAIRYEETGDEHD